MAARIGGLPSMSELTDPQEQRVVMVAADDPDRVPGGLREAVEVAFGPDDGVPPEELADQAQRLVRPGDIFWSDRRAQWDWGASGPIVQEVLIMFSTGAASGVTAALLTDGLKRLSKRWTSTPTIEERPSGDTAEGAWELFAAFLQRAFKASEPKAVEIESKPDGWEIVASASRVRYTGTVDRSGKVLNARLVDRPPAH
jgi:hypothetical protein